MADKNFLSFADCEVGQGEGAPKDIGILSPPIDFAPWNDTLKFSNASNGSVFSLSITGGTEDCVDFNRGCSNLKVYCASYTSNGPQVITVKGGCSDIWIGGIITKPGKVTDVDIDNYSEQNHGPSSNIKLNLKRADGKPVRWRSLKGTKPFICNTQDPYKCSLYLPKFIGVIWDRLYQFLKYVDILR